MASATESPGSAVTSFLVARDATLVTVTPPAVCLVIRLSGEMLAEWKIESDCC
jgi:hypothetical protein